MSIVLDLDYGSGVINAVTPKGLAVVLVSDVDGDSFVVEQPTLNGEPSMFVAHKASAHPSLPATIQRFTRIA